MTNLISLIAQESPDTALEQLLSLERVNPDFSPIAAQIGMLYAQMGLYDSAIAYMGRAVTLSPTNLLYRYNLAIIQDRAGLREEAAASYEMVLRGIERGGSVANVSPEALMRRLSHLRQR